MLKLTHLTKMTAQIGDISTTRSMPMGERQNYVVTGGTLEGRLNGVVLPGGHDFLLIDPTGIGHVDARLTWRLDDGLHVHAQYLGRLHMLPAVTQAFKTSGEIAFGDTYFITQLRFEAGTGPHDWLNGIVALGEGRVAPGRCIQYNIYHCEHG